MLIPVIDLFAGPGGLAEGFSAYKDKSSSRVFDINLSIESDKNSYQTLMVRTIYRLFSGDIPTEYYDLLRGNLTIEEIFDKFPQYRKTVTEVAWNAILGKEPIKNVDNRIKSAIHGHKDWVLVGGPPCQPYSMIGRARTGGFNPQDDRVYLYQEYYRILAVHNPPVFVMENVKGILNARINGSRIFDQILDDLKDPVSAYRQLNGNHYKHLKCPGYSIYSLVTKPLSYDFEGNPYFKNNDFLIEAEKYGIPQTRHRVILLGIRKNIKDITPKILSETKRISVNKVLNGLPKLRSGLSKEVDTPINWINQLRSISRIGVFRKMDKSVINKMLDTLSDLKCFDYDRGAEFLSTNSISVDYKKDWYLDSRIKGVSYHMTRSHMTEDLFRYLFAASFGRAHNKSPKLSDFPDELLPNHNNVSRNKDVKNFDDRFRVQIANEPSKTITSHLSKDGHYYIHPDPTQCRSLTVREAARIQTFPDNYFFAGVGRGPKYRQIGNAVPPLLAMQIANVVCNIFDEMI